MRVVDPAVSMVHDFVGPDLETGERVGPERVADRHIGRIASARDEHAADPRDVVPRVERMPAAADVGLEPRGKIHRPIRRRDPDVAEVAGAIPGRNVHAAAEGDRQMRVVAADALALFERLPRGSRRSGVLVVERDVAMDVVADRLHASGAGGRSAEQIPRDAGQAGRSRSIGCRVERRANPREGPPLRAAPRTSQSGRAGPCRSAIESAESRSRPAGATIRLHQFPNPSR